MNDIPTCEYARCTQPSTWAQLLINQLHPISDNDERQSITYQKLHYFCDQHVLD